MLEECFMGTIARELDFTPYFNGLVIASNTNKTHN